MAKKDEEVIEEPTLEDLEDEEAEEEVPSDTEEEKEEVETESLEARVEKEKKSVEEGDETEGSFISVDAAEKRNVKKSDKIYLKTQQPIEIDGDFFDYGPADISVKKHSIQLKI